MARAPFEDAGRARRTGPRALSVGVTPRYRFLWALNRLVMRAVFRIETEGLDRWPRAPFQLVCNHHNGIDPLLVLAATPQRPRITWFGPREADFSRGFRNRIMAYYGGVIPFDPEKTTLLSAVRAVRRVFDAKGVHGIFAEGRVGFSETDIQPLEEGASFFAVQAQVPVVPCAIIGSTELWLRRRILIRFGEAISTVELRGRDGIEELDRHTEAALRALLPATEPPRPRFRPLAGWLTDLLNGADDIARREARGSGNSHGSGGAA